MSFPGYSVIILDVKTMKELEFTNSIDQGQLKDFLIQWEVNSDKELNKLKTPQLPDQS